MAISVKVMHRPAPETTSYLRAALSGMALTFKHMVNPNKITQQGPPFLPYDPWAQQRRGIQRQEEQQLEQMTRIARERARDEPNAFPEEEE